MDGKKAKGIDKVSKAEYAENLNENIERLVLRMKRQAYQPQPSRRVYIDKPGSNKKRPLGISCYEDKLVETGLPKFYPQYMSRSSMNSPTDSGRGRTAIRR